MSNITPLPVCAALPPRTDFAPDRVSARQPERAGAVGAAADSDPAISDRDETERVKLRAKLTLELLRASVSMLRDPAPYSLSQESIDGLRSLGIPIDTLLAQNGNVWDQAGINQLQSLLNPPPPPPSGWPPYPYPSPYPYPADPTAAPLGDSIRSKWNRPYV